MKHTLEAAKEASQQLRALHERMAWTPDGEAFVKARRIRDNVQNCLDLDDWSQSKGVGILDKGTRGKLRRTMVMLKREFPRFRDVR